MCGVTVTHLAGTPCWLHPLASTGRSEGDTYMYLMKQSVRPGAPVKPFRGGDGDAAGNHPLMVTEVYLYYLLPVVA